MFLQVDCPDLAMGRHTIFKDLPDENFFALVESSNHRHAREWEVVKELSVPQDKVLMPGLIDTTSNTIEYPELVAWRILNYAETLGPDRVIGSTDCGFASTASAGGVSGEIAWLKLNSLVEGVKIANSRIQ